eukprot:scaffold10723_cov113-Isochrysis_galbana.AAC.11
MKCSPRARYARGPITGEALFELFIERAVACLRLAASRRPRGHICLPNSKSKRKSKRKPQTWAWAGPGVYVCAPAGARRRERRAASASIERRESRDARRQRRRSRVLRVRRSRCAALALALSRRAAMKHRPQCRAGRAPGAGAPRPAADAQTCSTQPRSSSAAAFRARSALARRATHEQRGAARRHPRDNGPNPSAALHCCTACRQTWTRPPGASLRLCGLYLCQTDPDACT